MPKSLKGIVRDNLNVPELIKDVLNEVAEPALDKLVQSTETAFDDAAKAAIWPPLEAALNAEVKKLWDKLMADEAPVVPAVAPSE